MENERVSGIDPQGYLDMLKKSAERISIESWNRWREQLQHKDNVIEEPDWAERGCW